MKTLGMRFITGLVVAILASATVGFAKSNHNGSSRKVNVTFSSRTEFQSGGTLAAGDYVMEIAKDSPTPEVRFYKLHANGYVNERSVSTKAAATVPAKLVTEQQEASATEVVADTRGDVQVVKSIQPAGWNERLVFGSEGPHAAQ
jgi:hypothetical protein